MNKIILSIVVPVYNVQPYLVNCIHSILNQSYKDFELILVDDGSPDNCGEICDKYAQQDSRIKVIHQQNGGLSAARNSGIEIAKGEYITFVDSDDKIQQDTYKENMDLLLADKSIDLLEYPVYVHYNANEEYIWKENYKHIYGFNKIFIEWIEQKGYLHGYVWNKIFKRSLFKEIRFPVDKTFEDIHTFPAILKKVNHFCISEKGLYYYYKRESSITTLASYKKMKDLLEANLNIWQSLTDFSISKSGLLTYYLFISNIVIDLFKFEEETVIHRNYVIKELSLINFSLSDLWKADITKRMKFKNITLITLGLQTHCKIYNLLHKIIRNT